MRLRIVIFVCFLAGTVFYSKLCQAQQTVGLFTKNTGEQDGYVLFTAPGTKTYLVDKCGKFIHSWDTKYEPGKDAYLLPNGNLLAASSIANPYFKGGGSAGGLLQIFNWNGTLIWHYTVSDSLAMQNHDIYPMPNGDILALEWDRFTPAQAIKMGRDSIKLKGHELWSVKVQEIKPKGNDSADIVWEWRMWDHLIQDKDSTKPGYGVVADHPELLNINYVDSAESQFGNDDWIHANAISFNQDLNQVMVSSRNLSELYIIDHSTSTKQAASHIGGNQNKGGDILYRWGNPAAYNRGNSSNRTLYVQHNPTWIPDGYPGAGNISVFNDGTNRPGGNFSTAEIFSPPVDSKGNYAITSGSAYGPSASYWSYQAPTPTSFYSTIEGGVQQLLNGNVLICESTKGNFFEVDPNKNIVWRYVNPDDGNGPVYQGTKPGTNICFRANLYMEDYPAFKNKTLTPGNPLELKPYYYNCYMPYNLYINPLYKISQLKGYNSITGIADSFNKGRGYIKGVVESQNMGFFTYQFTLIDSTAAITISTNKFSYKPTIGDSLLVSGYVSQYNGLTEYIADTLEVKPRGSWQKKPDPVNTLSEKYESSLIKLNHVWLTNKSEWVSKGPGFSVHITDGVDTFVMFINYKTDLYYSNAPKGIFNITGIEIQYKSKYPFLGGYQIEPRGFFDFQRVIQIYKIRQIRVQDSVSGISDSAGGQNNFYLKGIIQSRNFTKNGLNFSMQDSTGSVMVYSDHDISSYQPVIGDSVQIRGLLIQSNGLIEFVPDSITILKKAVKLINPVIAGTLSEKTEAKLLKLRGERLLDTSQWVPSGNGFNVDISNGSDSFIMRINETTDLFKMKVIHGAFNVTGIEIQNQPDSPYFGNYIIEPRGIFDIEKYIPLYKIRQVRGQDSINGIADSAGSTHAFLLKGIVLSPDFTASGYLFSMKDSTGAIFITSPVSINSYVPTIGDSIEIRGLLKQQNGLTYVLIDSVSKLGNDSPTISPVTIFNLEENKEAMLVKYTNATLIDQSQWSASGPGFMADITNGNDTITLYIAKATDLYNLNAPYGKFNVTGIVTQNKSTTPYFGSYMLMPRLIKDIQYFPDIPFYKIREIKRINLITGIADSINTYCFLKGIVQSRNLSGTDSQFYALQDSTGSIVVTTHDIVNGYTPNVGDSIILRGKVLQSNGLTSFRADSTSIISHGGQISPAKIIKLNESSESELVTLQGYTLEDNTHWDTTGAMGQFEVKAEKGNSFLNILIVKGTDLYTNSAKPNGTFDITGICSQIDFTEPYFSGYYIIPRSILDINHSSALHPDQNSSSHVEIFPNPAHDHIEIRSKESMTRLEISDMTGKIVYTWKPGSPELSKFDINNLKKGIYLLKVYQSNYSSIYKIIKD